MVTKTLSPHPGAISESNTKLLNFITDHGPVFVLTGAGISIASGLGAYRDDQGKWLRKQPITGPEFLAKEATRKRYWTRSFVGWPSVVKARPNAAHQSLATLHDQGLITRLVTQNVDGLHSRVGHPDVIDLHGNLHLIKCTSCGERSDRSVMQNRLLDNNPVLRQFEGNDAPDGDSDARLKHAPGSENFPADDDHLAAQAIENLIIPECRSCGGVLKPDVVFFGENVERDIVDDAFASLEQAGALLVIGSSLMIYSGYRFARHADSTNKPIAIVNRGVTRADDIATLKVLSDCEDALTAVTRTYQQKT